MRFPFIVFRKPPAGPEVPSSFSDEQVEKRKLLCGRWRCDQPIAPRPAKEFQNGRASLSHTTWNCKYHIVFAPKYRRRVIYGTVRKEIGKILRELCLRKGVEIIEAEACVDHIHMLVTIPPKLSVSSFMGYLKGKSSLMIFDRFAQMKYRFGDREFWCRGYFVDTVGKNKIAEYIRNQLEEDRYADQLVMNELVDPFTGEPMRKKGRK